MHIQYLDKQYQQTIHQITSFPTSPIRLSNNEGEHCKVPKNAHNDLVFHYFSRMNRRHVSPNGHLQKAFSLWTGKLIFYALKNFQICCHSCPLYALVSSWFGGSCDVCSGTRDFTLALISVGNKGHFFYLLFEDTGKMRCRAMWERDRYWHVHEISFYGEAFPI